LGCKYLGVGEMEKTINKQDRLIRNKGLYFKVSEMELNYIKSLAEIEGLSLSEFLRAKSMGIASRANVRTVRSGEKA